MRERGDGLGRDLESTLFVTNSFPAHFVEAEHTVMSPIRFYYQELGPEIKCTGTSAWTSAWSTAWTSAWSTTEGSGALRSTAEQSGAEN